MNTWIGIGRLVGDPDVRVNGDNKYARYTLAVDRGIKRDPNNPEQQTADFINCVCFGKGADFADTYLRKGTKIAVTGRIQTGKYTNKDGKVVYTTDVYVERHEFCESRSSGSNQGDSHQQASIQKAANAGTPAPQALDTSFVNIPDNFSGEVPFE